MSEKRLTIRRAGPVATVVIDRPQMMNALDAEALDALAAAFAAFESDKTLRVVILTGAGDRAFVAGADIRAMVGLDPAAARALAARGQDVADRIDSLPVPVIAAVNGFALGGGCELALACDFIYAARNAKLGLPEVGLGVIPGFGGTQRLPRRVGTARAAELIFSGRVIDADEALRIGLVNAVVDGPELLPRVEAVAAEIGARGPLAVAAAKRAMREGMVRPFTAALEREQEIFASLFATADQEEGMRAFIEKRPPAWKAQ